LRFRARSAKVRGAIPLSARDLMPRTSRDTRAVEPVGELKFGQVGVANLRIRSVDPDALRQELAAKVEAAPQLFSRAPVVLDLGALPDSPPALVVDALLAAIRAAGLCPIGLAYGTADNEAVARALDLPVIAKFRAGFERGAAAEPVKSKSAEAAPPPEKALLHSQPVRSGQQVYARARDLTLTAMIGNGAEVIADGSIHVYGVLRGRALAGAQGDTAARIFCQNFQPELISIAGRYRVFEEVPVELKGRAVQAWLEGEALKFAAL
jgi:septum site-determining protein MinC